MHVKMCTGEKKKKKGSFIQIRQLQHWLLLDYQRGMSSGVLKLEHISQKPTLYLHQDNFLR